ncbi:MAG: GAF domain-containing protein, partial [Anaerolineae bacterium]|nr:GAF domain-containing protein [Anaerolineae bacterium]
PSVARNLTWGLVLTVIVVLAAFNGFVYLRSSGQIEEDLETRATETADRLAGVLGPPLWNLDAQTIEQTAQVYSDLEDVVSLQVVTEAEETVFDYNKTIAGVGSITKTASIVYEDQVLGQVVLAISKQSLQQEQQNSLLSTVLSTVLITVAIIIVNQLLLRRLLNQPLTTLTQGLENIAAGDYEHRLAPFRQADMDAIVQGVNVMAGEIATRDQQLRELIETLEQRVAERTRDLAIRTRDLATVAEVSSQASTILDVQELLQAVSDLTKENFDLYHAHVYLLDEESESLRLAGGAGEPGRLMVASGHRIPLGLERSLVARAARGRTVVVADDVRAESYFMPNPMLPNTRSELAVALVARGELLGVLDVQSDEAARFGPETQTVMETLARQIAVVLSNARLFTAIQQTARYEQTLSAITQQIQSAVNIDEVLQVTARELGRTLRVPETAVELRLQPESRPELGD